jgi:prepilin-type N-terminal cleavage/methylation domain-containing protein
MSKIFHILRLINRNQRGFTLIELVIAMAIGGLIAGAVTMTMFQIFDSSGRTSNHMTVVRQVRSAGYWVSHDALMAQDLVLADESIDDPDGSRFPFTLTWSDWTSNEVHTVVYSIDGNELQRAHSVNSGPASTTVVADFIDSTLDDNGQRKTRVEGKLAFTVTATLGDGPAAQTETRTYEIIPRPGS